MAVYGAVLGISLGFVVLLMPVAGRVAARLGAMDVPGELSIHTRPIPRTGGLAILGGFVAAMAGAWWRGLLPGGHSQVWMGILMGCTVIAIVGLLDDVRHISPILKFLGQFLAASIAIGMGVQIHFLPWHGVGLTLTLLCLVGGCNAINLLDGMDGLAGGVSFIAALALGLMGLMEGYLPVVLLAGALAGATLGFLPFNFPRARIFMGDTGSLFLGFALSCVMILFSNTSSNPLYFAASLLVLGVPVLDTALALLRRFLLRRHLFSGDRDHVYDILARRMESRAVVLTIWAITALLGGAAVAIVALGGRWGWLIWGLAVGSMMGATKWGQWLPTWPTSDHPISAMKTSFALVRRRYLHPVLLDLLVVVTSFYLALFLRFSDEWPADVRGMHYYGRLLGEHISFVACVFAVVATLFGLYGHIWRYASVSDALLIVGSGLVSTLVVLVMDLLWGAGRPLPISVVLMGGLFSIAGLVLLRYRHHLRYQVASMNPRGVRPVVRERMLIVGAGEAGRSLVWHMQRHNGRYVPIGLLDDDPQKVGLRIRGVPVLGTISQVAELVDRYQADLVVVAVRDVGRARLREIFDECQASPVRIQVLPDVITQLEQGNNGAVKLRDLTIEDLVSRSPWQVDGDVIRALIADQVVLVTGAAGSIGSELCRQVMQYDPARLLAVDQNETGLYELTVEFGTSGPFEICIGDVTDVGRMTLLWRTYRPKIVFHCAAYKHVPILEECPSEAVNNNVKGTLVPAILSEQWGTERFIFVSTDKAVCPGNVLGASKRVGELLVAAVQDVAPTDTRFAVVRFGNVLGSRGSVMPMFAHQIAQGGPVTITHPEARRFFMSIEEAVGLVIQAGAYTEGGDLFVLEMGEEVYIRDLAYKMIRLQGLRVGQDVAVEHVGLRPGDKLAERLFCPVCEVAQPTSHPGIMRIRWDGCLPRGLLAANVGRMIEMVAEGNEDQLRSLLFDTAHLICPDDCPSRSERS